MSNQNYGKEGSHVSTNLAAIRMYVKPTKVLIVPVEKILNFELGNKNFPYDALVQSGVDEGGEPIYEPASILDVSGKFYVFAFQKE